MGKTILLADKSITIQKIVELTFADEEFAIKSVNDGQTALELIPQIRPDVVLADISLPVRNGYELCSTLRTDPAYQSFASTPVILLAGIYETMDEERARQVEQRVKEVGADDLLSKPFDPQLLTSKVRELIERQESAVATPPVPEVIEEHAAIEPAGMFNVPPISQEPEQAFDTTEVQQPVDDAERTMMLPGGPALGKPMFAETPPFDQETLVEKPQVNVEALTPVEEPVFEAADMETAEEAQTPEEEEEKAEAIEPQPGGPFQGREELEFSLPPDQQQPVPQPVVKAAEPQPVAAAQEPFDVFGEPSQAWTAPAMNEDDAPFGLPEPPLQHVEKLIEPEPQETARLERIWPPPAIVPEAPKLEEEDRRNIEQIMGASALKPDFGEDTWSRAKAQAEKQAVDELFEGEPVHQEVNIQELEADLADNEPSPVQAEMPKPIATAPAAPATVEMTDEVIDRIAERVVARLSEKIVTEIVWQVVPDLAEKMIRRELEKLNASGGDD